MPVRMLRGITIGASALLGLALITSAAHAQAQTSGVRFGVEGAVATEHIGIGAGGFLKYHLANISEHPITGRVAFDYFFPSSTNFRGSSYKYWELAADGLFDIATEKSDIKPYVGAGITYAKSSFDAGYCNGFPGCSESFNNTNLHLVGGINFMGNSKLMPFAEVKVNTGSGAPLIFKGGIHIH